MNCSRAKLMELLDEHCHEQNQKLKDEDEPPSEFDFLYLPIDFKSVLLTPFSSSS